MKKIIMIVVTIFLINMIAIGQCYQRPNGSRYLTQNDYGIYLNLEAPSTISLENMYYTNSINVYDIAQPHYSDSLLTIVGVSALLWWHDYRSMDGYFCIADTNFYIHRFVKIPSSIYDDCNYTEVFFEEPINVYGRFMAIWDNPKPRGYGSLDYNYDSNNPDFVWNKSGIHVMNANNERIPYDYNSYFRRLSIDMTDNRLLCWFDWTPFDTTIFFEVRVGTLPGTVSPSISEERISAYLFPIFGELDTTLQCIGSRQNESEIKGVSMVEKYTNVFPNPAIDEVNVQCSFRIKDIEIYNILGEQVLSKEVNGYNTKINTSSLPKGNYILRVKTNSGTTNNKLVVE